MTTQQDERAELIRRVEELTKRFSEGWHDGIKIDATDIATLSEAAALLADGKTWDLGRANEVFQDGFTAGIAFQKDADDKAGGEVDTGGVFPEWKAGTSAFKQWCCQYFGPDADESYLAEAVLQLPRKRVLPMKSADEFELHRLLAEERYTVRQLNRALREATEAPTFMGEPVTRPPPASRTGGAAAD